MNKAEIKRIIVEEIESALYELTEDVNIEKLTAQAVLKFIPDEDFSDEELEEMAGRATDYTLSPNKVAQLSPKFAKMKQADRKKAILQFLLRVRDQIENMPKGRGRSKALFSDQDLVRLAQVMSKDTFSSKELIAAVDRFKTPQNVNAWLPGLRAKGFITYADRKGDEEKMPIAKVGSTAGSKEREDLFKNLEEYIKQQIKEAKNPLAKKMKEIENQGRVAALETKLAAIAEMIEETNARLTRIDEDEEFTEMMDKNAVKEVRKQLKELEKAKDRLEKEKSKAEGKMSKKEKPTPENKEVVDEMAPEDDDNMDNLEDLLGGEVPDLSDPMDYGMEESKEKTYELNESVKRMQKLANLKG